MQVDRILSALAVMRQRLMVVDGAYYPDQVQHRLLKISMMRDFVIADDSVGLTNYCQTRLAGTEGDTMSDILDELWEELDLGFEATWDDFEALLA